MNALTRLPALVELEVTPRPRWTADPQLLGVGAAIVLWVLLHAGLAVSWLSAGRV